MTYIINLTIVMQNLFWMQSILATKSKPAVDSSGVSDRVTFPITRRLIKRAFNVYLAATDRDNLLTQISNYTKKVNFVTRNGPDMTIKEITRLLNASTISSEDAFKQQSGLKDLDESWEYAEDEPWDLTSPVRTDVA